MSDINTKEFFDELLFCLKEKDLVKSKALLQFAIQSDADPGVQKKVMTELVSGDDQIVFPLLEYLAGSRFSDPEVHDALYLLVLDKACSSSLFVEKYLMESAPEVRRLFIRSVGELFLTQAAPMLQEIIQQESDQKIVIEAIHALGKLRLPDAFPMLADMASLDDPQIKRAAVFAISRSGISDAVDQLIDFMGEDEATDIATIEALAEIQDLYAMDILVNFLGSKETIVRDTAIDQLVKLGSKVVPVLVRSLQHTDENSLVHIITTLGYINDPAAVIPILDILNTQPSNPNIRQSAYEALERIDASGPLVSIVQGLLDPVETVRMSAARAISRNVSIGIAARLRFMLRELNEAAGQMVATLIDTDAAATYPYLVTEKRFKELALAHVCEKADPATRKVFLKQMTDAGQDTFVNEVSRIRAKKTKTVEKKMRIIVIDDSIMILKMMINKLAALGFQADAFDKPELALPEILDQRPDLIITDLNMPKISGLELSRVVRKKYSLQEVPILLITTQSDYDDGMQENQENTLINQVLHKPFSDEEFSQALASLSGTS